MVKVRVHFPDDPQERLMQFARVPAVGELIKCGATYWKTKVVVHHANDSVDILVETVDLEPEPRKIICAYCDREFHYQDEASKKVAWDAAVAHDTVCLNNPVVAKYNALVAALRAVEHIPVMATIAPPSPEIYEAFRVICAAIKGE